MRIRDWWSRRTMVERVVAYTLGSLYSLYWFLLLLAWFSLASASGSVRVGVLSGLAALALAGAGTAVLRDAARLHPQVAPLPWRSLGVLLVLVALAVPLVLLLPDGQRIGGAISVIGALSWGAGGLLDKRVRNAVIVGCTLLAWVAGDNVGFAAYGLVVSAFLVFTVQSSLWLMGVVTSLEQARDSEAALAVTRERLRFSQDVHDVLGRRLSTIAVQAELAAALAARGDSRATDQVLEIRATAHEALREARELARGYRPPDLAAEVEGAVSLLGSAGIAARADVSRVPPARHEPVARVVREAVTNVLRHSRATQVEMAYDGERLTVSNDGVDPARAATGDGSGLSTLADHLAGLGARLEHGVHGDRFVVAVDFAPVASEVPS